MSQLSFLDVLQGRLHRIIMSEPRESEIPIRKVGLDSPLGAKELRNSGKEGWTGQAFGSQGAPKFR